MASLMEELLDVLKQETEGYDALYDLSDSKRDSIVAGDIDKLDSISEQEQVITSSLKNLENSRVRILSDMAVVLGQDGEDITVTNMIDKLANQPKEQEELTIARDKLIEAASKMQLANQQNQLLLAHALELVEFDLTLMKSLKQAPETANYNRDAYNTGDYLGNSGFDAKQ